MNFELTWGEGGGVNHADHRAVGLTTLDACRDAANRWMFTDLGEPWQGVTALYVAGTSAPTHFVDVTATIEAGVASLREHQAYIDGLGTDFDPDEFLRNIAGFGGMAAGLRVRRARAAVPGLTPVPMPAVRVGGPVPAGPPAPATTRSPRMPRWRGRPGRGRLRSKPARVPAYLRLRR